jgi:hypothetical protein
MVKKYNFPTVISIEDIVVDRGIYTKHKILICASGLPDGVFSNQKSKFGYIFEGLGMKKVRILWPFGIVYGHLVI